MIRIAEESVELVPQAIVSVDAETALAAHAPLDRDCDGLDHYVGATFRDADGLQVAVRTYAGFPPGSAQVYLDDTMRDVDAIRERVGRVCDALGIDRARIAWRRGDDAPFADWHGPGGGSALPPGHRAARG